MRTPIECVKAVIDCDNGRDGKGYRQLIHDDGVLYAWPFLEARVMVFCLPLWAAFPASGGVLSDDDWEERQKIIKGFDSVLRQDRASSRFPSLWRGDRLDFLARTIFTTMCLLGACACLRKHA